MIDWDKWQEIFDSIMKHPIRTTLTALGVFWGIFMLVLLLGLGNGLRNGVEYEFMSDASNSIWLRRGKTSKPYKGLPKGRLIKFYNEDFKFLNETFEDVEHLTGRFYLSGNQTVKYGSKEFSYPIRGVHPGHAIVEVTFMNIGRYINEEDMEKTRKVCVIGRTSRDALFGKGVDPVGKEIQIGKTVYKIVGLYYETGGEDEMRPIYLPISTVQRLQNTSEEIHQLMFTAGDLSLSEMKKLESEVRAALAQRHMFDVNDSQALFISNVAEDYQEIQNVLYAIKIFVWFIGLGSLFAGVIGVSNIMLIIVKERTKEIGIRKAMGATPGSIIGLILQESVLITMIAGYLGMLFAIGLLFLMSSMEVEYFRHPNVDYRIGLAATAVLVLAGALAGLMPAIQAARVNPVEAMRSN